MLLNLFLKSKQKQKIAKGLLLIMVIQFVSPLRSLALTSGPSQPEVQHFEPVGTTDMVDLFSGDFVYNIPLLDVDGYPINISYHSGANIEQEASWVGLGWNINPGVINRSVRGVPDDFMKDSIGKELNIKKERNIRVGVGVGFELAGSVLSGTAGIYINSSNYRGLSAGVKTGVGLDLFGFASAGVNMGIGSQDGADLDYNAGISFKSSENASKDMSWGVGITASSGYNSRTGIKDFSITGNGSFKQEVNQNKSVIGKVDEDKSTSLTTGSSSATIPIGLQNFVPVITNASTLKALSVSLNLGGELWSTFPNADVAGNFSWLNYDHNGTRNAYGYLYLDRATENDILDFTRDKDGMFNKTMPYLPSGNMTYDVYSASAQGSGGLFRPFRNDFGSVFDPVTTSPDNESHSISVEVGLGNLFEVGGNYTGMFTKMKSGPWDNFQRQFTPKTKGSVYEDTYFKQAGELTEIDSMYKAVTGGNAPLKSYLPQVTQKPNSDTKRDPRATLLTTTNADEASLSDFSTSAQLMNYTDPNGLRDGNNATKTAISRTSGVRNGHQISEITQLNTDGRRFVYGIPAMNNVTRDLVFSVEGGANTAQGTVSIGSGDISLGNSKGTEHYYSSNVTPSYAHSYLLTSVLSTDYVDVLGDGVTDDDLGSFVKFNYSLKDSDYRWRTPYSSTIANYNPGFKCDGMDDKGFYNIGSKEQWYLHSIESKNYVAEFYTSVRKDGQGSMDAVLNNSPYSNNAKYAGFASAKSSPSNSYKLDSIKLYNKHDRFINKDNAIPIKTVMFSYDYSLCKGIPNTSNTSTNPVDSGKLTLKRIYTRYGNSDKSLISPYEFTYSNFNPNYDLSAKDRWGDYKPTNASLPNYDHPYVNQDDASNDTYAKAWQLTKIGLPSGGVMNIEYEADDYAFVQDRRAMEMYPIEGVGKVKEFSPNASTLYKDAKRPFDYIYFKCKPGSFFTSNMKNLYLQDQNTLYYDFAVDVCKKNIYDQVRGYADVVAMDYCPGTNQQYGYIKVATRQPKKSEAVVSPMVYSGLNMGRYNLSHIFYPGSDDNNSDLENIIKGLDAAAKEMIGIFKNPIKRFLKEGYSKQYLASKSFIRLMTPSLAKKGGGSRVKRLTLDDSWNTMVSNESNASYGSEYSYTTKDANYGIISSGVASYEPLIGGDENPFREIAKYYKASKGSNFPPNDAIELMSEEPIGESLYPSATVGYSRVQVKSIHAQRAQSAQTSTISEFYTARDYPLRVEASPLNIMEDAKSHKGFFKSEVVLKAGQAFSIIMNDMHGKPKSTEVYRTYNPNNTTSNSLISSVKYFYQDNGNKQLDNKVNTLAFVPSLNAIKIVPKEIGRETDMMIDTREKNENTNIFQVQLNLNTFLAPPFPIPIPMAFYKPGEHDREFASVVNTKVIQEYGILKTVEAVKEGAKTYMTNELYDPISGSCLYTKINNEFRDNEYTMQYPAYWTTKRMGSAYSNIGFIEDVSIGFPSSLGQGKGSFITSNMDNYNLGDELLIQDGTSVYKVWITGRIQIPPNSCYFTVEPRNRSAAPASWSVGGSTINVISKVVRSGRRNMLNETVQTITSMDNAVVGNMLQFNRTNAISTQAKSFTDNQVYCPDLTGSAVANFNDLVLGKRGNFRIKETYAYDKARAYAGNARKDGTFVLDPIILNYPPGSPGDCGAMPYDKGWFEVNFNLGSHWKAVGTGIHYTPWGNEIQSLDALGIPSSAIFGYDNTLPVAVASNCFNENILYDGFEDYRMLNTLGFPYFSASPFKALFPVTTIPALPSSNYRYFDLSASVGGISLINTESHTGNFCLKTGTSTYDVSTPIAVGGTTSSQLLHPFQFLKAANATTPESTIISMWVKPVSGTSPSAPKLILTGGSTTVLQPVSNAIEGWYLYEAKVSITNTPTAAAIRLPANVYIDDVRAYPSISNMKSFVYNPINQKLMATLDENNYASFYEYDHEGALVRVKKETEKGILTIQESRSSNKMK